ncbi:MAG: hypothetical protein LAO03_07350 [Acidobacteriia bacterium]|nr:hypothetical protein [Terriglobia bacterium]
MRKHTKPGSSYPKGGPSTFLSLLTGWMQQGIASFSATQRIFGEVAMRQNAAVTKTLEHGRLDLEHSPVAILSELAIQGTSSFMEAQKILLNLVQQENEIVMNGVKERVAGSTPGVVMTDLVRRSIDTFIRMQQDFLKTTRKQTLHWLEAVKAGEGYQGTHLVDLAREDMETFVHAQGKFLDVIAQETAKATGRKHEQASRKMKKTELSKLAHAATNSFIEAQKRLLEVVSQQMNMNLKAATRTVELVSPARLLPVASLTQEGVKSFVGAEKALIESIVKPGKATKVVSVTKHRPQRAVHHRKTEKVQAARATA